MTTIDDGLRLACRTTGMCCLVGVDPLLETTDKGRDQVKICLPFQLADLSTSSRWAGR